MKDTDDLLRAVATGDRAAFSQLYRALGKPMLGFAAGLLSGDVAAAEDVVDAAFIAVWQGAARWSGPGSSRSWIRQIVRNKAVDWLRVNGRYDKGLEAADLADLTDPCPDPEQAALRTDATRSLAGALGQLSFEHREAVILCYFEDLPLAEIARIASCPEGTIKTRLFHARKQLRGALFNPDEGWRETL